VVIHSFAGGVKTLAKPHLAVQVFDFAGGFWCNSGFPEAATDRHASSSPRSRLAEQQEPDMKRTYQASKVRRARTHGFLVRMKTRGGRAVINARRAKGRKRLAV
jgi:large subunit ribosomal protein L34